MEEQRVRHHLVVQVGEELDDQSFARASPVAAEALAIISSTFGSAMPNCRPSLAFSRDGREDRVALAVVVRDHQELGRPALLERLVVELLNSGRPPASAPLR